MPVLRMFFNSLSNSTRPISDYLLNLSHALFGDCYKIAFVLVRTVRQASKTSVRKWSKPPKPETLYEGRSVLCLVAPRLRPNVLQFAKDDRPYRLAPQVFCIPETLCLPPHPS